jgi:hypothetical protein
LRAKDAMALGAILVVALIVGVVEPRIARPLGSSPGHLPTQSSDEDANARVDAFWTWWRTAAPRLARELDAGHATAISDEISSHVDAIDRRLAWETGPGLRSARYHLALSPEGEGELRVLTERWLSRAPPSSGTWEFYPARQAFPPAKWNVGLHDARNTEVDSERVRVGVQTDTTREVVNVKFYHPTFAELTESERTRAAFIILDNVLGEDGVERWVGEISTATEPLADGIRLESLSTKVDALAKTATGERFSILSWRTQGGAPIVATANLAVKRVDHLLMDQELTATLKLRNPTRDGLTASEEAAELNRIEDELIASLGNDAIYLGRETGVGNRVLHFHVARNGVSEARTRQWASQHREYKIEVTVRSDPDWTLLRRWRSATSTGDGEPSEE